MILITGATGKTGTELTSVLSAMGEEVRAFVHNPEKQSAASQPGVEVVTGDYSDPSSLDRAMDGVDRVFVLAPSLIPDQETWERNITDAAVRAGVKRIVKHSVIGATSLTQLGFIRRHWEIEKYIEKTDIPFVFIRPTTFMQNLLAFAESIARDGKFYDTVGDGLISAIDVRDVASVEALVLTSDGHDGKIYELTGEEALTYSDMAGIISKVIGRPIEYIDISTEEFRRNLIERGLPETRANDYPIYHEYLRNGAGAIITPWVQRLTGGRPLTFEQFARDYASVFSGQAQKVA